MLTSWLSSTPPLALVQALPVSIPPRPACRGILTACQKSVQCGVGSITLLPVGTAAREDERGVSYWL